MVSKVYNYLVKTDPALTVFVADADLFVQAAEESYADISRRLWRTGPNENEGYYLMSEKAESMPADNVGQPFNYLGKHACTELALYRITNKPEYLDRATRIINLFKNRLTYDRVNGLYVFNYWYEPMTTTGWTPADDLSYNTKVFVGRVAIEDISHGGHVIEMIMEAYRMNVVFTETDVRRFARTFLKNVLTPDRQKITRFVDGTGDYQSYFISVFQWLALGEVNPEVVKAGLEIYENRTEENIRYTARLLRYEHLWDAEDHDPEFVGITPNGDGVVFVKQGSSGMAGDSWDNAVPELADALKLAKVNLDIKEIWVAKGTYKPLFNASTFLESPQDRDNAFVLVPNVKVFGGFDPENGITDFHHSRVIPGANHENPANASILSGDIDGNNILDEGNAHHVVISVGEIGTALLDGFIITGGHANGTGNLVVNGITTTRNLGAGMYTRNSSPTLTNVSIIDNKAASSSANTQGGGMYNHTSSPVLIYTIISRNEVVTESNQAQGGGIFNTASSPVLTNVIVRDNSVVSGTGSALGAGIFTNNTSSPELTNVLITGNRAQSSGTAQGGGLYTGTTMDVHPILKNVTVSGNTSSGTSPEWHAIGYSVVHNSIVYGNGAPSSYQSAGKEHSLIQGQTSIANGMINASTIGSVDDLFNNPANGDFTLNNNSLVLDKGNNALFTNLDADTRDLVSNLRVYNDVIDLGAYEYFIANIKSVNDPELLRVDYGATWGNIQTVLPTQVTVVLNNDVEVDVPLVASVDWVPVGNPYDGNTFGDFVYEASLIMPDIGDYVYFTNLDDLKARITISVRRMMNVTLENVSYIYDGTPKSLSITGNLPSGVSAPVYTINGQQGNAATDIGIYTVEAQIDGGSEYHHLSLLATMTIHLQTRTIAFPAIPEKTYGDADFVLEATSNSEETILYSSNNESVAILEGNTVKIIGAGETMISATVPEDPDYYANTPIEQRRLIVRKASQQIDFTIPAKVPRDVGILSLSAYASSGLPVTLELVEDSRATLENNLLYVEGKLGAIRITATQPGDDNFEVAIPITVVTQVVEESLENLVRVYPAVSPNGDGINDFLVIVGIRDYPENKLLIHDSEGRIVYEIEGYDNANTVFTGEGLTDGTYFYQLEITVNGQRRQAKGFLQVKRN